MFFANKNSWICEIIRTFALAIVPPLTERWNVFFMYNWGSRGV